MSKVIEYAPMGVCCKKMDIDVEDGVLTSVQFHGGCDGNLKGVASLTKGMKIEDVIARLSGINCRGRGTSCPDQLAKALKSIK